MNRSLMLAALAATLCATSAFALEPRQPSGQAGIDNLAAFQKWVNAKQPAHVVGVSSSCKTPVWSSACGSATKNGFFNNHDDRSGGGNGGGKDN